MARRLAAAVCLLVLATPALAQVSPFEGVWQVVPRGPPGGGPVGRPGGPPDGGRDERRGPPGEAAGPALPEKLAAMLDRGDRRVFSQMTPAGQAMFATFDPKALPANNCRSPGLPSVAMTPNLQVWTVSPGKLSIHHEYFDTRREIALGEAASAGPGPPTPLGHATGRIEGERLTIVTTGAAGAWSGLGRNAPSSDARVVRETYMLSGPDTLTGQIEIEDPTFLVRPLRMPVNLRRAPAGTKIESFPCDLEASKRDVGG